MSQEPGRVDKTTAQPVPVWNHPSPPGPRTGGTKSVRQILTTSTSAQRGHIARREPASLGFESQLRPYYLRELEQVT